MFNLNHSALNDFATSLSCFELDGQVHGRHYRASWDFLDGQELYSGYEEVFRDGFYRVYVNKAGFNKLI